MCAQHVSSGVQVAENLIQRDGDFLIRDSLSSPGNYVLTCQWKNSPQHFKINKMVVAMNEAYSRVQYLFEKEGFDSVPALVRYYVGNRKPVTEVVGAIIFQPINRALPLRCLEEKYGVACVHVEAGPTLPERKSQTSKRLSLNIMNGHTQDHSLGRGNLLRLVGYLQRLRPVWSGHSVCGWKLSVSRRLQWRCLLAGARYI